MNLYLAVLGKFSPTVYGALRFDHIVTSIDELYADIEITKMAFDALKTVYKQPPILMTIGTIDEATKAMPLDSSPWDDNIKPVVLCKVGAHGILRVKANEDHLILHGGQS